MSTYGSPNVGFFLIGGRSVLGTRTSIDVKAIASAKETTALGDTWAEWSATGITRGELSQEGFFDDAAGAINEALCEREDTSQVVLLAHEGNTAGKQAFGFAGAYAATYDRKLAVDEFHQATATHTISGQVEMPTILAALAARTTAGNTEAASIDNTASSANGGGAYLQVSALTLGGYTNLVVKVRHSADNITFADLATFTAVTAAPASERKAVAAGTTVNQYLAISWAWTGAGSGQSATFTVAFARA
jgi:hypothetical protein